MRSADVLSDLIEAARAEARLLEHGFVGVEHLLLGLLHDEDGLAAQALASLEVSIGRIRERVREIDGVAGSAAAQTEAPALTPRAEGIIEFSREEALHMGAAQVEPEHVLLAIVDEGQSVAAAVLREQLGPDLVVVRRRLMQLLSGDDLVAPEPPRPQTEGSTPSAAVERSRRRRRREGPAEPIKCSFCGKSQKQVEKIIAGPGVFICNECVELCVKIIDEARRNRS